MNMKKLFTKTFALIAMGIFATTMAFAQGQGGHSHTTTEEDTQYGSEWEIFHFPNLDQNGAHDGTFKEIQYYNGGHFDNIKIKKMLGDHWVGRSLSELREGTEIFLCNMKTNEYMQIGDYWGENSMTNHSGITYTLQDAIPQRRVQGWSEFTNEENGYWLSAKLENSNKSDRAVGRTATSDGITGNFEHNRYLALRAKDEYYDGKKLNDAGDAMVNGDRVATGESEAHPGAFLFHFKEVQKGGKTCYIIYTHRKTSGSLDERTEFMNRDSYLLIRSHEKQNAGYHTVRFKKFAGQMYGTGGGLVATIGNKTNLNTITDDATAESTNAHKYGTYSNAAGGTTFTTNSTSGLEGVTVTTGGNYLKAAYYETDGNGQDVGQMHTMEIVPPDNQSQTVTVAAPTGWVITGINLTARAYSGARQFTISGLDGWTSWINASDKTYYKTGLNDGDYSFTVNHVYGTDYSLPLCFPQFTVTLKKAGDTSTLPAGSVIHTGANAYGNNPMGDEISYYNDGKAYVSLEQGLADAEDDDANLWKIVTAEERNRYRLVASENEPVDMTQRLKNPKFYTAYTYTRSVKDYPTDDGFTWDGSHYMHTNGERDFGWQWFDDGRKTHYTTHHIHPFDQAYVADGAIEGNSKTKNPGIFNPEEIIGGKPRQRELHKVGTGVYYRFHTANMDENNQAERKQDEYYVTWGQDGNYVGSMWKGTSNLQQTIGTGAPGDPKLLEGLYVVRVKGFYAPHDMMRYHKNGSGNYVRDDYNQNPVGESATTSAMNTGWQWYQDAIVTTTGPDKGKWKRSHDSYLFAWGNGKEVRRMLPSIYEGAINFDEIGEEKKNTLSKEAYMASDDFPYTGLGKNKDKSGYAYAIENMRDETNFAVYNGAYFSNDRYPAGIDDSGNAYSAWNYSSGNWVVPKTLIGAGRWFNVIDGMDDDETTSYANARKYQISLPVYVGSDGLLTLGVDHTYVPTSTTYNGTHEGEAYSITMPASRPDEWVCFDDFELFYLGKQEPDEFVLDELNGRLDIGYQDEDFYEYDPSTGELIKWNPETKEIIPAKIDVGGTLVDNEDYKTATPKPLNPTGTVKNMNNTQWIDLFDPTDIATNPDYTTVKKLVIRRTLTKDGWGSIVFPVPLTGQQIKEGFGENAKVAYLTGITDYRSSKNTIQYTLVDLDATEVVEGNTVSKKVIEPGMPYVIKPSIEPMVSSDRYYERSKYTIAYSSKAGGVANRFLRDPDRNKEVERKLYGPLYIIENVGIKSSEVFPDIEHDGADDVDGDGTIWPAIGGDETNQASKFGKRQVPDNSTLWEIQYKPNSETYRLVETAHYEGGGVIPAYSYFHTNGQMYYTTTNLQTNKGLYSYLQLLDTTQPGEPAYSKGFLGGSDYFVPVVKETDGIEDVNMVPDLDGNSSMVIYDLMGRKVTNPRPGNIYIMNGVKVMFK